MYIAFVSYSNPMDYSGSSRYAHELSAALVKLGNDVTVFTVKSERTPRLIYSYKMKGLSFINLPYFRATSFALAVSKEINRNHFDIIHSQSGSGIFLPVLHVETHHHTPLAFNALPHYLPALISAFRAKKVIAVSEISKLDLLRYGISGHKIIVIHNGVDFNRFNPNVDGTSFKNALGVGDAKLLLYVGGFNKNKNLVFLLKVMKQLKKIGRKVFLLMIGKPHDEERRLLHVAKELGVSDVIRTMCLPDDLLPRAYSACDLFVCSSYKEGFGLPFLEAVACGKRFVSTPVGIAPKLAKMGFGRIASHSTREFVLKIIEELDERPRSPSLEMLKREFSWFNVARKVMQVYKTVIEN